MGCAATCGGLCGSGPPGCGDVALFSAALPEASGATALVPVETLRKAAVLSTAGGPAVPAGGGGGAWTAVDA